ncbi:MAG: L,D-transpeptidase [Planctomycetes bacterium]|nr:L,D-transpeptidase [Planctomycetota bacterium]
MKKLKFLFKMALFIAFLGGLFVALFLQEVGFLGNGFEKACREKGIALPLQDPRLVVDVGGKTLSIYEGETLIRRYDVASGRARRLGALDRDSNSTPVGEYRVVRKAVRESMFSRGSRFLQIDYPNADDADRAWDLGRLDRAQYDAIITAVEAAKPPPENTPIGGNLGIQGNYFSIVGDSFTDGSIALSNGDIVDLFDHIPLGTPVTINP